MKKLYMTKSREKQLHNAISIDDILYRKFELMEQRIHKHARHLDRTYKNVIRVQRRKSDANYIERIIAVQKIDGEGLLVTIE